VAQPTLLLIGGSGFVSGTLAREALAQGYNVTAVTRGKQPLPSGVKPIVADRKDRAAFRAAIDNAKLPEVDLVVDCIAFELDDAKQCVESFAGRAKQFVFISTDFVYDPAKRKFPQGETDAQYAGGAYGGGKHACELELANASKKLAWTVLRPCHIYGPGSLLGCCAPDNRDDQLINKIKSGQTLKLVGARLLQQPIFARDLAKLILSVRGNAKAHHQIFNAAGPDIIESWMYYQHIADALGVPLKWEDQVTAPYLAAHPEKAPFLCHRIYDLTRMKAAGLAAPSTPAAEGLREHVRSLLA